MRMLYNQGIAQRKISRYCNKTSHGTPEIIFDYKKQKQYRFELYQNNALGKITTGEIGTVFEKYFSNENFSDDQKLVFIHNMYQLEYRSKTTCGVAYKLLNNNIVVYFSSDIARTDNLRDCFTEYMNQKENGKKTKNIASYQKSYQKSYKEKNNEKLKLYKKVSNWIKRNPNKTVSEVPKSWTEIEKNEFLRIKTYQ